MAGRSLQVLAFTGALALSATLVACGDDDDATEDASATVAEDEHGTDEDEHSTSDDEPANACPAEGCKVRIVSVSRAGGELEVAFEANHTADVSRNHFHVYWDTFTSKQVSDDAEPRFGVTQGAWVPTADNPFTTTDAVAVAERGQSSTLCVTSGDRDHNVLDADLFHCRDVSDQL